MNVTLPGGARVEVATSRRFIVVGEPRRGRPEVEAASDSLVMALVYRARLADEHPEITWHVMDTRR